MRADIAPGSTTAVRAAASVRPRVEARRKAKEGAHEVVEVTELEVLKEIRDALLAERAQGGGKSLRTDGGGEQPGAGGR